MVTVVSTMPHPSVVKEVICDHCGSTLNYVPADVHRKTVYSGYLGDKEFVDYIRCPNCKSHQLVAKK
jgi:ribosomal protein S27E